MLFQCAGPAAAEGTRPRRIRRRGRSLRIDIHCHAHAPAAEDLVKDHFSPEKEPAIRFANERTREVNRRQLETIRDQLVSVERRLADMDRMGIDVQVVSPSPFQYYYWAPPLAGLAAARAINDRLAGLAAQHPDRLRALGTVPLQAPALAERELVRCVRELGMRGVELNTNVGGRELSRSGLDSFFTRAEELGAVLFLHPHGFTDAGRLVDHYFNNVIGNPLDTTVCVAHLIFDGVLDRHPGLRVCVAHGGGYLAAYGARMDHAHGARPDCRERIAEAPSSYLRRLYVDSMVFAPDQLESLVRKFGSDHVMMGTDYPFDMGETDPVGLIRRCRLTAGQRADLLGRAAARLFGIAG